MSVTIGWLDASQTIMVYTFIGSWTWEELYPIYEEALRQEAAVPHHVDVICDMSRSGRIPGNVLTQLVTIGDRQPPNVGLTIFVTTDPFARSLHGLITRVKPSFRQIFGIAPSMAAAVEQIAERSRKPT